MIVRWGGASRPQQHAKQRLRDKGVSIDVETKVVGQSFVAGEDRGCACRYTGGPVDGYHAKGTFGGVGEVEITTVDPDAVGAEVEDPGGASCSIALEEYILKHCGCSTFIHIDYIDRSRLRVGTDEETRGLVQHIEPIQELRLRYINNLGDFNRALSYSRVSNTAQIDPEQAVGTGEAVEVRGAGKIIGYDIENVLFLQFDDAEKTLVAMKGVHDASNLRTERVDLVQVWRCVERD